MPNHIGIYVRLDLHEMQLKGEETDIVLVSNENVNIKAHKFILDWASDYFHKLFHNFPKVNPPPTHFNLDFDTHTLEKVVTHTYIENFHLYPVQLDDWEQAEKLLTAASHFQLWSLFDACCTAAEQLLFKKSPKSFHVLASWIPRFNDNESIKSLVAKYVKQHSGTIFCVDECLTYIGYTFEDFSMLLKLWNSSLTEVKYNTEEMVLKIISWVRRKWSDRAYHAASLFAQLPLERLSTKFIKETLLEEDLVKNNCEILIQLLLSRD